MIDLHYKKFESMPGTTADEKYAAMCMGRTPRITVKYNGIFAEYNPNTRRLNTKHNKMWPDGFFHSEFMNCIRSIHEEIYDNCVGRDINLWGEIVSDDPTIPLATLAGDLNVKGKAAKTDAIKYRIFDIFAPGELAINFPFFNRNVAMHGVKENAYVAFAEELPFISSTLLDEQFKKHLASAPHTEGLIYAFGPGLQIPGESPDIVKRKRVFSGEFVCVDIVKGKAGTKRYGMLSALVLLHPTTGETFRVGGGPGMTNEVLEKLQRKPPIHKQVTVEYQELSVIGTPLRPSFIAVRDYE